jgi:hypothetical protein
MPLYEEEMELLNDDVYDDYDGYSNYDSCSVNSNLPNSSISGKALKQLEGRAYYNKHGKTKTSNNCIEYEPGHYVLFRSINHKKVPIELYMTKNQPGYLIRNAVSGIRDAKYRVGRKDQDMFFSVKLTDQRCGANESYGMLFYDSPEEYERHFHTTVDQDIKEKWNLRRLQQLQSDQTADAEEEKNSFVVIH